MIVRTSLHLLPQLSSLPFYSRRTNSMQSSLLPARSASSSASSFPSSSSPSLHSSSTATEPAPSPTNYPPRMIQRIFPLPKIKTMIQTLCSEAPSVAKPGFPRHSLAGCRRRVVKRRWIGPRGGRAWRTGLGLCSRTRYHMQIPTLLDRREVLRRIWV